MSSRLEMSSDSSLRSLRACEFILVLSWPVFISRCRSSMAARASSYLRAARSCPADQRSAITLKSTSVGSFGHFPRVMDSHPTFLRVGLSKYGESFFSKKDINEGEVVFEAEPIAWVPIKKWRPNVCWECFRYTWAKNMPACSHCKYFRFCSEECKSAAQFRHERECAAQARMVTLIKKENKSSDSVPEEDDALLHLLVSLFVEIKHQRTRHHTLAGETGQMGESSVAGGLREKQTHSSHSSAAAAVATQPDTPSTQSPPDFLSPAAPSLIPPTLVPLYAMVTNRAHFPPDHVESMRRVAALVARVLPGTDVEEIIDMICREECNSFGYRDSSGELFAYAMLPTASKFNHSCAPNIIKQAHGRTYRFLATCAIPIDTECCISYAPVEDSLRERTAHLQGFLFTCECPRCVSERREQS
eukprot:m.227582 g.227582  ORF g.227582 m.227582 type:complete len:417 (+) comp17252_c0_seq1:526-1776(+)